jgi:hypothetical protein
MKNHLKRMLAGIILIIRMQAVNLAAIQRLLLQPLYSREKWMSRMVLISVILTSIPGINSISVDANARLGIYGNGTSGINIDINAAPYTDYAKVDTWGQYAYGAVGCAWYAAARVNELTGIQNSIYSGNSWYNTFYAAFGFTRGQEIKAYSLACYEKHVAVVENIDGDEVTVSEGGYETGEDYGYCIIHTMTKEKLESDRSGKFVGYVYFGDFVRNDLSSKNGTDVVCDTQNVLMTTTTTQRQAVTADLPGQDNNIAAVATCDAVGDTENGAQHCASKKVVKLKKVNINHCKNEITKVLDIHWDPVSRATEYQIQYATKSMHHFRSRKTSLEKLTLKHLKIRKKYHIRVRAIADTEKGIYYGKWSKTKNIQVQ